MIFFSDLHKFYKYYDGGRYYNDYYYILKNIILINFVVEMSKI